MKWIFVVSFLCLNFSVFAFFRDKEKLFDEFLYDCTLNFNEETCTQALHLMTTFYSKIEKTEMFNFKRSNFGDKLTNFNQFKNVVECCGCHLTLGKVVYENGQKIFTKDEIDDICLFKSLIDDKQYKLKLACKETSEKDFQDCKKRFLDSQPSDSWFFDFVNSYGISAEPYKLSFTGAVIIFPIFLIRTFLSCIFPNFATMNANIPCAGCNHACGGC